MKKNRKHEQFKRWSMIGNQQNTDASDEYYTLPHAFYAILTELLARYKNNIVYKVIICPCDNGGSVFRELVKWVDYIGKPRIIYSYYPQKDWVEYFDMDFEKEYGCKKEEVLIFTNPPFTKLCANLKKIQCNFLLFCSKITSINNNNFVVNTSKYTFIKNTDLKNNQLYGTVPIMFVSNTMFYSFWKRGQYTVNTDDRRRKTFMFNKNLFKKIYVNRLYKETRE